MILHLPLPQALLQLKIVLRKLQIEEGQWVVLVQTEVAVVQAWDATQKLVAVCQTTKPGSAQPDLANGVRKAKLR